MWPLAADSIWTQTRHFYQPAQSKRAVACATARVLLSGSEHQTQRRVRVDFRVDERRLLLFRLEALLDEVFLRGTRAPDRRAFDRPMAIACLRLVTFLRDFPLFNVPRLRSRMVLPTFLVALLLYFGMVAPFW